MSNEAATLDNRTVDPTVNLSVNSFDNTTNASGVDDAYSLVRFLHRSVQTPHLQFRGQAVTLSISWTLMHCLPLNRAGAFGKSQRDHLN